MEIYELSFIICVIALIVFFLYLVYDNRQFNKFLKEQDNKFKREIEAVFREHLYIGKNEIDANIMKEIID